LAIDVNKRERGEFANFARDRERGELSIDAREK